ncbi:MAG: YggT family protein [Pyrinomonadaceae bacterium]|nr:YggT family protein [Pyrinomonadaceae bacterium]
MIDNKLEQEEAQRTANYEAVKSEVKSEVGGEIAVEAERSTPGEQAEIDKMAGNMRRKAVNELVETENEVELSRTLARFSQVVDYIFFVIYGLLTMRLLLALFAARSSADFVQFIRAITDPFYAPFRGIVASPSVDGFTLALPIVIAIIAYMLLHLAIIGFLRIFAHRKTAV